MLARGKVAGLGLGLRESNCRENGRYPGVIEFSESAVIFRPGYCGP